MRLPRMVLLMLGLGSLAGCAYVQKGDENKVEIGHSSITNFTAIKDKADAHCAEFHRRAVLQEAVSAADSVFRCEAVEAAKPAPQQPGGMPVMMVPAPNGLPPGAQPGLPPGYTYVYPQGSAPYPQGAAPYPQGGYPQAYMVPPGYGPQQAPPTYAPARQPPPQPAPASPPPHVPRRPAATPVAAPPPPVPSPALPAQTPPSQAGPPAAPPAPGPVAVTPAAPSQPEPLQPGTALLVQ